MATACRHQAPDKAGSEETVSRARCAGLAVASRSDRKKQQTMEDDASMP
jgi:hypothetical protein